MATEVDASYEPYAAAAPADVDTGAPATAVASDASADQSVSVSVSGLEGPQSQTPAGSPSAAPPGIARAAAAAAPLPGSGPAAAVAAPLQANGKPPLRPNFPANGVDVKAAALAAPVAVYNNIPGSGPVPMPMSPAVPAGPTVKVCCKFLPLHYGEKELHDLVVKFGAVSNVKIIREHPSGTSKGYGFVEFNTQQEAVAAIQALNGLALDNKTLRVEMATGPQPVQQPQHNHQPNVQGFGAYQSPAPQPLNLMPQQPYGAQGGAAAAANYGAPAPGTGDHTNLYVAGLPITFTKPELQSLFSAYGEVQHVYMLVDKATGQGRGVGFVRMGTTDECHAAIRGLHGQAPHGLQQAITVRFSRQDGPPPRSGLPPAQPAGYGPYRRQPQHSAQSYDPYGRPADDGQAAAPPAAAMPVAAPPQVAASNVVAPAAVQYVDQYGNPVHVTASAPAAAPATVAYAPAAAAAPAALQPQYYIAAPSAAAAPQPQLVAIASATPGAPPTYAYINAAPAAPAPAYADPYAPQPTTVMVDANGQYYAPAPAAAPAYAAAPPAYAAAAPAYGAAPAGAGPGAGAGGALGDGRTSDPNATLFVFHLPQDYSDEEMRALFHPYGQLTQCRIVRDKTTGANRGFGFVSFATVQEAQGAIHGLNGVAVKNKHLRVSFKKAGQQF